MSKRSSSHHGRRWPSKQGPRPRDLTRTNARCQRKRTRSALRSYRYLRAPQLYLADVAIGAGMGFGVLATAMVIVGVVWS